MYYGNEWCDQQFHLQIPVNRVDEETKPQPSLQLDDHSTLELAMKNAHSIRKACCRFPQSRVAAHQETTLIRKLIAYGQLAYSQRQSSFLDLVVG
jgi:hypothetical protein